jgi:glycosyltransferase involved in cell wall biosynthesis
MPTQKERASLRRVTMRCRISDIRTAEPEKGLFKPMWMDRSFSLPRPDISFSPRHVAIAIPARDEEALILNCLTALDRAAANLHSTRISAVIFVNNSADRTAEIARSFVAKNCSVIVEEAVLCVDHAHAGGARRMGMDRAAQIAGPSGVIMTSDADSEVCPDWIAANLYEFSQGADAVAGTVTLNMQDRMRLRPMLMARDAEWQLAQLQARIITLLDPVAHDPWPAHIWEWGASLAVTCEAYAAVGGMPSIPLAEDRAFAALLARHDFKLRHSHLPVVYTSGRLVGRAPMGLADLVSDYCNAAETPCDAAIEPTRNLIARLQSRNIFRRHHGDRAGFGACWHDHDAQILRERVFPAHLAAELCDASVMISQLEEAEEYPDDTLFAEYAE